MPESTVSRTDTLGLEPRYLDLLEQERARWWSARNFETWKNLYVGEYARGFELVGLLGEYVPELTLPGADVLDVGCGDAGVPIALAKAGARAAGVEPSAASRQRGRLRAEEHGVSIDLREGTAEALPFEKAAFSLVVLDNVLEHVGDERRALSEAHRVLRPGGVLYAVVPKPYSLHSLWADPHYELAGLVLLPRVLQRLYFERLRGGGPGGYDVGHISTRRRLRRLLREAGFELLVSPRELWIHYLRRRLSRPEEIRAGLKRRVAEHLNSADWAFQGRLARWLWDVALGSNRFLAKRTE